MTLTSKVKDARIDKYRTLSEDDILDIDFLEIAEYNQINEGYVYTVRNYDRFSFAILGRKRIKTKYDGYVMEVELNGDASEAVSAGNDGKRSQHKEREVSDWVAGNQRAIPRDVEGSQKTGNATKGRGIGTGDSDNKRGGVTSPANNSNKSSLLDSDGNQLSQGQQEFFAQSQACDNSGRLLVLYHQTDGDFTIFDTRHPGAGSRDSDTPFGIFLKRSAGDIGLAGKKQMALYANIKNPLRVTSREDLSRQMREISSSYAAIADRIKQLDTEYHEKLDQAKKAWQDYIVEWRAANPDAKRSTLNSDPKFNALFDAEDAVVDEWTAAADRLSTQAKEAITEDLRKAGYDGIFLENDVGSWGRKTDAIIALDPEQVKSITNKKPTGNPDIHHSDRTSESISNRSLLANAFESMAQNDIERQKIAEYKSKIETKEAEERKLRDLKVQIKEMSFAKGPRDTAKLRSLREEAIKTANRLSIYDGQLLRLEASKPLQNVLLREKKKAYDRAKTEGKKAIQEYKSEAEKKQKEIIGRYQESRAKAMEGRNKTAMRHKIQNVVGGLQQDILTTK